MNLTEEELQKLAELAKVETAVIKAFISVESGGKGFDPKTGKLMIQFEPHWFSKFLTQKKIAHTLNKSVNANGKTEYTIVASDKTLVNGVQGQQSEWQAFNAAFQIDPDSAMLATSIGLMQVMGFHHITLGYQTVGEMWDDFKKGEFEQARGGLQFIISKTPLYEALKKKDWPNVARFYNGPNYAINKYDVKLKEAYEKFS